MTPDLIESQVKIIKSNIKILERGFENFGDQNIEKKLQKEKEALEKLKDLYPEFFI